MKSATNCRKSLTKQRDFDTRMRRFEVIRMFFKSLDQRIADLGFKQVKNNEYGIEYERNNGVYIHKVALLHKANGKHILQSYDPVLCVPGKVGNTAVGLTYKELTLFAKKMKQIRLN